MKNMIRIRGDRSTARFIIVPVHWTELLDSMNQGEDGVIKFNGAIWKLHILLRER